MIVSRAPRLDRDAVHVWTAWIDVDEAAARKIAHCLSDDERARRRRFRFERDGRRFGVARGFLRHVLSAYLPSSGPGDVRFGYGSCGKPHLLGTGDEAGLRFNLAHSGGLVAIAVSHGEVGIDLEENRPELVDERLAVATMDEAELGAFRRARGRDRDFVFFSYWTRTEALLKAAGVGLSGGLGVARNPAAPKGWKIRPLHLAPGFVGAVAASPETTRFVPLQITAAGGAESEGH